MFEQIYKTKKWGSRDNTLSGTGSRAIETRGVVKFVSDIVKKYHIKTVGDVCGDFAWQHDFIKDSQIESYFAYDASETAVLAAKARFENLYLSCNSVFEHADLCTYKIKPVDLFICRDVLVHLSFEAALSFLNSVCPQSKYLLVTSFTNSTNRDIVTGDWRALNMLKYPFTGFENSCVEEFLEMPEANGVLADKRLLLIKLQSDI